MDLDRAVTVVNVFLTNYIKREGYFGIKFDKRKIDLKEVSKNDAGTAVKVIFMVDEMYSVNDPAIRKSAKNCIKAMRESKKEIADIEVEHDFVAY